MGHKPVLVVLLALTALPAAASRGDRLDNQTPVLSPAVPARSSSSLPFVVFFDLGSIELFPEATGILDTVVAAYRRAGSITVTGYADREGNPQQTLALSRRRAEAVKAYLIAKGIPEQVIAIAAGASKPLIETVPGERQPQSRRVEISLSPSPGD